MSKKMTYKEFLSKAREVHGDKFIYNKETENMFNGSHSVVAVICPKHGRYEVIVKNHLKHDCEKCSYEKRGISNRLTNDEFKTRANEVHNGKYIYTETNYEKAHSTVDIICPIHGKFTQLAYDHLNGKGCPKCNDSHLERDMINELDKLGIEYERKKHFNWLKRQEIDFYFPKYNIGVECQGKHHLGLGGWNDSFNFDKIFELDLRKNAFCTENGIKLLYLVDKHFYDKALEIEMYNKDNLFTNTDELINKIKIEF